MSTTSFQYVGSASAPVVADNGTDEQRARLFQQFNTYWLNANREGVPYDTIGTMSVMASIYGILAKYGKTTTAEYLEILADSIRDGVFSAPGDAADKPVGTA